MKIKTKVLTDFLKKCQMDGVEKVVELILKFEKSGLKISAQSPTENSMVLGWLKPSAFKEYNEIGNLGINELDTIIKVINRFGEFITLTKEGNLLTVSGDNKKVDIELVAENFLATEKKEPNLDKLENTFSITSNKLKDIFADASINKDTALTFETVDKGVKISNTGKYKFNSNVDAPSCKVGTKVTFGDPLFGVVKNLDSAIEFSIGTNYPAKIIEKTEHSVITLIVGPRVED